MTCKYDDGKGWCTGKFSGFGCIKDRCDSYAPAEDERYSCTGKPGDGTYCHKYKRFYCAGMENCADAKNYIRKLKMSSC